MASTLENNTNTINDLLTTINNLPNALTLDTTLTQSGQAADAKAVGDRFDGLNVKNGEGAHSVVAGLGNVAKSEAEFVVGKYNKTIGNGYKTVTSSYYEDYGVDLPTLTVTRDSTPSLNDSGTFDITEEFADQAYRQVYSWFSRGSDICIILSETSYIHVSDMDYTGAGYSGSFISGTRYDIIPNIIELSFSIGNGTSDTARSNAHTVDWEGNGWFAGNVSIGANKDKLVTQNHTHTANDIAGGTFKGSVYANSSYQYPDQRLLRNSKLVSTETTPTTNGEIFWTYE